MTDQWVQVAAFIVSTMAIVGTATVWIATRLARIEERVNNLTDLPTAVRKIHTRVTTLEERNRLQHPEHAHPIPSLANGQR